MTDMTHDVDDIDLYHSVRMLASQPGQLAEMVTIRPRGLLPNGIAGPYGFYQNSSSIELLLLASQFTSTRRAFPPPSSAPCPSDREPWDLHLCVAVSRRSPSPY